MISIDNAVDTHGINYYKILSLEKYCNEADIKQAYRRCALRYNTPAQENNKGAKIIFTLAAEAYDVLSDPIRRDIYDQYGENGLKNGVSRPEGISKPYIYHGDPMRTFREFFANENPYKDLLSILTEPLPLLECIEGRGIKRKEEPLIKILYLTLSEIFFGGIKKIKIQRLVLSGDDKSTTVSVEKILTVPIKPGLPAGTRIVFLGKGDEGPTKLPADVIFVTKDRPHETFRREGISDLHTTVDIFLREALTGTVITLNTIDDRILRIPITSIVTPDYTKRVPGEGMPFTANPKQRGDLILEFNIEFPVYMPICNKNYIKKAFAATCTPMEDAEYINRLILASKMRRNVEKDVALRRGTNDEADRLRAMCEM